MNAAAEGSPVNLSRWGESLGLQPRDHKPVDWVSHPSLVSDGRRYGPHRLHKRPVRGILRPGPDPLGKDPLLFGRKRNLGVRRRHHEVGVVAHDPGNNAARAGVARHDRPFAAIEFGDCRRTEIEPQSGLLVRLVRAVALEAAIGEDRPHIAVEVRAGGGQRRRHHRGGQCDDEEEASHDDSAWPGGVAPEMRVAKFREILGPSRLYYGIGCGGWPQHAYPPLVGMVSTGTRRPADRFRA